MKILYAAKSSSIFELAKCKGLFKCNSNALLTENGTLLLHTRVNQNSKK